MDIPRDVDGRLIDVHRNAVNQVLIVCGYIRSFRMTPEVARLVASELIKVADEADERAKKKAE